MRVTTSVNCLVAHAEQLVRRAGRARRRGARDRSSTHGLGEIAAERDAAGEAALVGRSLERLRLVAGCDGLADALGQIPRLEQHRRVAGMIAAEVLRLRRRSSRRATRAAAAWRRSRATRGRAPAPPCPAAGRPERCLRRGRPWPTRRTPARRSPPAGRGARSADSRCPTGRSARIEETSEKLSASVSAAFRPMIDQRLAQVLAGSALGVERGVGDPQDLGGHRRVAADGLGDLGHLDVRIAGERDDFRRDPRRAGEVDLGFQAVFEVLRLHASSQRVARGARYGPTRIGDRADS